MRQRVILTCVRTVSAPFRGTQAVYALGERADGGAPAVHAFSVGNFIAKAVHVASYFAPFAEWFLDLHADSRKLSYRQASFGSLLGQLWRSDWAEGVDATPYDVTFEASDGREARLEGIVNPRTFYKSYVACMVSALVPVL